MRTSSVLAALIVSASIAAPAAATVLVVGSGPARECYEAARDQRTSDQAMEICNVALATDMTSHNEVATYVNRGIVKLYRGNSAEAVRDFDKAIALDPQQPESYLNKGSALLRAGASPSEAIPLFNEALERNTKRPELAYFARAIAHEVSGDVRSAYRDYQRARQLAPKWEEPAEQLNRFEVRRASSSNM